ncbi:organic hydroperoxide resistance protein [Kitasatospora acidiphila]|uniref:Organic hydroperoxide resistance protein n=1 Tax=Kitasatospora acidiphila TaxID=2567942 RepID=A0A540W5Y3_9ACTN|nr:organic hydroperoxide resistance protein [Kitasatospora acidiphila]TQF04429.1 organic hydroperoxide resistance protein [Kitasatospora acidiphila]
MSVLYTTEALSTGDGRNGEVRTSDGVLDELLAVPKEMGGPGGDKTNPEQLFAAGYAACFHNGLRLIAGQQKVRLGESTIRSTVSLIALDNGGFSLSVALLAHLPGLDQATADQLMETTHQVCPYSNATRGNISVTLEATV